MQKVQVTAGWGLDLCCDLGFFQGRNGTKAARGCSVREGCGPGIRKTAFYLHSQVVGTQVFVI